MMIVNILYNDILSNDLDKCQIIISQYDKIDKINQLINDKIQKNTTNNNRYCLDIIYKNIILNENNLVQFYKISPYDEIWIGKLEKYLTNDDVIIEIFMAGLINDWIYLIMNKHDRISNIRSILEIFIIDYIDANIWNINGQILTNDQIIEEIHSQNRYYRIIINCRCYCNFDQSIKYCDDIDKSIKYCFDIDQSFKYFYYIYDQLLIDKYLVNYDYLDWSYYYDIDKINKLFNNKLIEEIINKLSLFVINYMDKKKIFIDNLSEMPSCFLDSRFLFYDKMMKRYQFMFDEFWSSIKCEMMDKIGLYEYEQMKYCIILSFNVVMIDFIYDASCSLIKDEHKSIIDIFNSKNYKILICQPTNIQYLIKLFLQKLLLRCYSDSEIYDLIDERIKNKCQFIDIKLNGSIITKIHIPPIKIKTIGQLKNIISKKIGITTKQLMLINKIGDEKLNDEDLCDVLKIKYSDFIVEIINNMDDIEILHHISSGSFGSIHLCQNKYSKKLFVLKKPKGTYNLFQEIKFFSKMSELSKIARSEGIYSYGGKTCLAMEYFPGGNLKQYIKEYKYLPEQETARISRQLLTQIKEIHNNKIVHRDIKSDNIVLDAYRHVKLIDFGMWKTIDEIKNFTEEERMKSSPGTIYYAAPEFINCEKYNEKIDIWSFGSVVIEMITGKKPFDNLSPVQVIYKMVDDRKIEFRPPKPISEELKEFINNCTEPDPNNRANAQQLIQSRFINQFFHIK